MTSTPLPKVPPLTLYQVELTSYCDMKCSYCPHPEMERGKGHMSPETLAKCIEYAKKVGQKKLVVHHFGEPLMHPQLKERLTQIADAGLNIEFSTNGLLLEKRLPMLLEIPGKIHITLSMHQWADQPSEHYFAALKEWQKRIAGTNITFQKSYNTTEGSKYRLHKWANGTPGEWDFYKRCHFLRDNIGVVLWDGRIASCCVDVEGTSSFASIHDEDLTTARTCSWEACRTCDVIKYRNRMHKLWGMEGRNYTPWLAVRFKNVKEFYIGLKHFVWDYKR